MLRFTPRTEEQVMASRLLGACEGTYEVFKAEIKADKNGNDQLYVVLKAFDDKNKQGFIHDYLFFNNEEWDWKLRHFMYSCGLGSEYESGFIDPIKLSNRTGKLKIGIKKASENYPAKNIVLDYLTGDSKKNHYASVDTHASENPAPY